MGNMGNLFDGEWYSLWRSAIILDKSSKYASIHKTIKMATCETPSDYDNLYRAIFRREVSLGLMESKQELKEYVLNLVNKI
jgi:hypothetical protein